MSTSDRETLGGGKVTRGVQSSTAGVAASYGLPLSNSARGGVKLSLSDCHGV